MRLWLAFHWLVEPMFASSETQKYGNLPGCQLTVITTRAGSILLPFLLTRTHWCCAMTIWVGRELFPATVLSIYSWLYDDWTCGQLNDFSWSIDLFMLRGVRLKPVCPLLSWVDNPCQTLLTHALSTNNDDAQTWRRRWLSLGDIWPIMTGSRYWWCWHHLDPWKEVEKIPVRKIKEKHNRRQISLFDGTYENRYSGTWAAFGEETWHRCNAWQRIWSRNYKNCRCWASLIFADISIHRLQFSIKKKTKRKENGTSWFQWQLSKWREGKKCTEVTHRPAEKQRLSGLPITNNDVVKLMWSIPITEWRDEKNSNGAQTQEQSSDTTKSDSKMLTLDLKVFV